MATTAWFRAATLTERSTGIDRARQPDDAARQRAERRLDQWAGGPAFVGPTHFDQRLAMDGLDRAALHTLLAESDESLHERLGDELGHLRTLDDLIGAADRTPADPAPADQPHRAGFGRIVAAFLAGRRTELRRRIDGHLRGRRLPFDPAALEEHLYHNLLPQLFVLGRTMVLELHVARLRGQLTGDTPEERFEDFCNHLEDPTFARALLEEYPVLARYLHERIDDWVDASSEFVERLATDWPDIVERFCPGAAPGDLTGFSGGAGDVHRRGRSVHILTFASGFRVVYKPRPVAADEHFQELLAWLNARSDRMTFRTIRILGRPDHGWVEFVYPGPCPDESALERFYARQGGYLAVLHALGATDFHLENLIAAGEHPVLVDLEALFHSASPVLAGDGIFQRTTDAVDRSVLRIGLLPVGGYNNGATKSLDVSGLGGAAGQLSPVAGLVVENAGTDRMEFVRKRNTLTGADNRPTLNGAIVDTYTYAEAVVGGFADTYRLLMGHRDELLAPDGPVGRFGADEVRYIARSTRSYAVHLVEGFHPDLLRDALDRERFLDSLWRSPDDIRALATLFPYERADLLRGDIPIFTTRPESRDLVTSWGEVVGDFFPAPAMNLVRRRINELSDADLEQQKWYIRASLTSLCQNEGVNAWPRYEMVEPPTPHPSQELLKVAAELGERLEFLALREGRETAWLGLTYTEDRTWTFAPAAGDLYSGLPGIGLFLGHLGRLTGDRRHLDLADDVVYTLQQQWKDVSEQNTPDVLLNLGGFGHLAGMMYLLDHMATLSGDDGLRAQAVDLAVRFVDPRIDDYAEADLVAGLAGCVAVLRGLAAGDDSGRVAGILSRCGERLLATALRTGGGVAWPSVMSTRPLAGFSHGAAGIAWALLEVFDLTGDDRYRQTALGAFEYERGVFDERRRNWPELRELPGQEKSAEGEFMTAWCHGAPGVGLSRVLALRHIDDERCRQEIDVAVGTTLRSGFGTNHSLCHGDLGNAEFLLQAGRALNDPALSARASTLVAGVVDHLRHAGPLCGVPSGVETPGLLTGIAGIGMGLLRFVDPDTVPSVLTLDPPKPA